MILSLLNKRLPSQRQKGVTMIEYALIAALIAVVAIVAIGNIGDEVTNTFNSIVTELQGAQA